MALRSGLERVIVWMKESPQAVRVSTPIGTKFPMYYGGASLCIFTYLTSDEQEQILAHELRPKTPDTECDPNKAREVAMVIRERGYHVAVGDFANSAFSVAAPVFGTNGKILARFAWCGPMAA